jgi:hypothetical protein
MFRVNRPLTRHLSSAEKANTAAPGCLRRPGVGLHSAHRSGRQPRRHRRLRPEAHPPGCAVQQGLGRQDPAQAEAQPGL